MYRVDRRNPHLEFSAKCVEDEDVDLHKSVVFCLREVGCFICSFSVTFSGVCFIHVTNFPTVGLSFARLSYLWKCQLFQFGVN